MMRVLLSTIGSRGDVQPLVALAMELKAMGDEVRLCVPPDFRDWIENLGMPVTPIGPAVRSAGKVTRPSTPLAPDQLRQMVEGTVIAQFETIASAAEGCDVIVGATALQVAAPSVAEYMGIPYVFAAYCPAVVPSPHHAPPVLPSRGDVPAPVMSDYRVLWEKDAQRWNETWGAPVNSRRTSLGLPPVSDVHRYVLTGRPWLAADPILAPWPDPSDDAVFQTGAWILPDDRALSDELEAFLDDGEPPVYFGFGSNPVPENLNRVMIESGRALGRRVIVLRGWADLLPIDDALDCLVIGEVNQQALFKRVAAVVHHGGAGTTTAAARAGAPQVIIPQHYDQHYFGQRVHDLEIGVAHAGRSPTTDSLTSALARALQPVVAASAQSVAGAMRADGARVAAQRLAVDYRLSPNG